MAGITQAIAEAKLAMWLDAEAGLAQAQSYEITESGSSRRLTRANLTEVKNMINYWEQRVMRLSRGGIRVRGVQPLG